MAKISSIVIDTDDNLLIFQIYAEDEGSLVDSLLSSGRLCFPFERDNPANLVKLVVRVLEALEATSSELTFDVDESSHFGESKGLKAFTAFRFVFNEQVRLLVNIRGAYAQTLVNSLASI